MYIRVQKSLPKFSISVLKTIIRKCTSTTQNKTENVIYPPILDLSYRARIRRKGQEWHDKIKKLETVEEKIYGINMPHYYGWKSLHLKEGNVPYNSLQHAQYITRTHLMNDHKLPDFYDSVITTEQLDTLVQTLKYHIKNIVMFEYNHRLTQQEIKEEIKEEKEKLIQNSITNALVFQINRILLAALSPNTPHLLEAEIDFEPRVEAFWFVGGIERSPRSVKAREKSVYFKHRANDPVNVPVQYLGSPILQLRHQFPLREILSTEQSINPELSIPTFKLDPRVLVGMSEETITVQAIFASYAWLLSQASYQGFSTVNDITYPLVSQTILTNGRLWSFCVYQLNTTLTHTEYAEENPKRNVCWITESLPLFDKIENGQVHGFNEDVLKKLITFYINIPAERSNENMKPYLGESVKHIADITNPYRRVWLESRFKHLMSNRPRHYKQPEIYHWQKIYLIDNNTRFLDKKRDPWQFGYSAYKRKLNDHLPIYIPRCLRRLPNKRKIGRWAKTYYPDA
ncbi:28S ribosomal protein S30, mitochondrial [Eufriesea mexicana]|nr:28S ribosomal protein S30, mitochondrial [Eufriesea mexicana]